MGAIGFESVFPSFLFLFLASYIMGFGVVPFLFLRRDLFLCIESAIIWRHARSGAFNPNTRIFIYKPVIQYYILTSIAEYFVGEGMVTKNFSDEHFHEDPFPIVLY